jgi:sporulation protein YlmC with PRC-barrel domain
MRIDFRQLRRYTAYTTSGTYVGKVFDVTIDVDSQQIIQYDVTASIFHTNHHLIHREQIVRFEDKKIIVEDSVVSGKSEGMEKKSTSTSPEAVAMRE